MVSPGGAPFDTRPISLILALTVGGCFSEAPAGPDDGDAPAATVQMTSQLRYEPQHVTIQVGEAIRWQNSSSFPHTVTGDPQRAADGDNVKLPAGAAPFHSGSIQANGDYQLTFDVPGEYTYFCIPHEGSGMIGTITVTQ